MSYFLLPPIHVRSCFLVRKGFSALSFIESKHSAFSVTVTCRCLPRPHPLSLFCTMTKRRSSTDIFSHSPRRLLLANHDLTDFLLPWHFLQRRATHRAPPADTVSAKESRSSQSAHLRSGELGKWDRNGLMLRARRLVLRVRKHHIT